MVLEKSKMSLLTSEYINKAAKFQIYHFESTEFDSDAIKY